MVYIRKIEQWFRKVLKPEVEIIYLGNGATDICGSQMSWRENKYQGKKGVGTLYPAVYQKLNRVSDNDKTEVLFKHNDGIFVGYHVRKKVNKSYQWYAEDGKWYTSSELFENGKKKRTIAGNEKINTVKEMGEKVYLVAQWENTENRERMQAGYPVFCHELMAHAHGACGGLTYTNTREALERSYKEGYRYFETDVALTEDRKLVLSHGWDEKSCGITGMEYREEFAHMTRELFMQQRIGGMQVMDIGDLKNFMAEHPDTYFEIDLHRSQSAEKVELLQEAFGRDEKILNRLLIQAESRKIFEELEQSCPFKNYQLVLGKEWKEKLEEGITFAFEHGIETIAMRYSCLDERTVGILKEAGLNVMAYTIKNDVKRAKELLAMGVDTICTDEIKPADLRE